MSGGGSTALDGAAGGSDAGTTTSTSSGSGSGSGTSGTSTSTGPRTTSTAPTGRSVWRGARAPVAAALVLVLVSVGLAALHARGDGGTLDPRSYAPGGTRAAATLLGQQGHAVRVVGDLPQLRSALRPDSTVAVVAPGALTPDELADLGRLGARLVVTGATTGDLDALGLPVSAEDADVHVRRPACALAAATRAGAAVTGGHAYTAGPQEAGSACYGDGGRATVLDLPARRVTLLGTAETFTNDRLDDQGDAALTLGVLGSGGDVLWLLPDAGRALPGAQRSLRDLLPDAVPLAALQLGVAAVALALWRARRLGRVVSEPLPVVVRAAESVEGRSRLYQLAGARGPAAEALRSGARDRLARRVGLRPDALPDELVRTVAARGGRAPDEVGALLFGPPPPDDAALVRLADGLDGLTV